ncbi:MAG: glycosyltransferase family 39 protein [Hyphomicrobiaceae bacterium]|nr:glycosyltransferase family 39 protein [Hyphomicrobiaceae bacterium]
MIEAAASRRASPSMPGLLLAAVVAVALLRAVVAAATGLTDDESYYRLWALAPAISYLDHPPMVGWLMAAGRAIAGDTAFGLRLPALLISLAGPFLLWRTAALLFGREVAVAAVLFSLAMPLLAVGGVLLTPDAPSVFFWGLCAWALAELHVSRNANWWLAVGLFAGLGLLSKYTNLFVGAGILLWLLAVPRNRAWLASWQLWAGGLLAALLTAPVIVWNARYHWASFDKQLGRAARGADWSLEFLLEMLGGYIGLASPLIAVIGLIGLARILREAVRTRDERAILIVSGLAPVLLYFLVHALHARVQANWLAPLYPVMALLAGYQLSRSSSAFRGRWLGAALAVGAALTALVYAHALHPFVVLPGSRDPTSQMRGWQDFAGRIDELRRQTGAAWVGTGHYTTQGQLAFALRGTAPVMQVNDRLRYVHLPPVEARLAASAGLVVELDERLDGATLTARFRSVRPVAVVTREFAGVVLGRYRVWQVADPVAPDTLFTYVPGRDD